MDERKWLFKFGQECAGKGYTETTAEIMLSQTTFYKSAELDFFWLGFLEGSFKEK